MKVGIEEVMNEVKKEREQKRMKEEEEREGEGKGIGGPWSNLPSKNPSTLSFLATPRSCL